MRKVFESLLVASLALSSAAMAAPVSSTDAFEGATINATSAGVAQAGATFDGSLSDPNNVTFFNAGNAGDLGFVNFSTSSAIAVNGIRLFAGSDGPTLNFRRSMQAFRFYADSDNDNVWEQLVGLSINVNYALEPGNAAAGNLLELTFNFSGPVTSSKWRYEVNQGVSRDQFDGVRVQEIDALTDAVTNAVPEPGSLALVGLAFGTAGFVARRRRA